MLAVQESGKEKPSGSRSLGPVPRLNDQLTCQPSSGISSRGGPIRRVGKLAGACALLTIGAAGPPQNVAGQEPQLPLEESTV